MLSRGVRGPAVLFHARVRTAGSSFERSGVLTPYVIEELDEDARALRPGARLEVAVDALDRQTLADLKQRLGRRRDLRVDVAILGRAVSASVRPSFAALVGGEVACEDAAWTEVQTATRCTSTRGRRSASSSRSRRVSSPRSRTI